MPGESSGGAARCLCLAGPTAAGKTAAALAVARDVRAAGMAVEIISVDSALVYRGMDIGTAKPSAAERRELPHHLIDIVEPTEAYSAARFVADARRLVDQIAQRGALPLLVGGTMMYFKALFDGLDSLPPADAEVRQAIDARAAREGWPALHAELAQVDPITAARLAPADSQRIQRALEVWQLSGRPLSSLHARDAVAADAAAARPPLISLEPAERAWLHRRIGERFDAMLDAGLVDEVRSLRARGDLHEAMPSMRCVGYRQVWQALDTLGDDASAPAWRAHVRETGAAATRQLAKRQLTWLRGMPWREVVACDAPGAIDQVVRSARVHVARLAATRRAAQ